MSAQANVTQTEALCGRDGMDVAADHIAQGALKAGPVGKVGLELEFHLIDRDEPLRRPVWRDIVDLVDDLPAMPHGSPITLEPGGQIELSTPPHEGVANAIDALAGDVRELRTQLSLRGFGTAALGADPVRAVQRINPSPRYAAMERHFAARGCVQAGKSMMTATAALQISLDAGEPEQWDERLKRIRRLEPILIALSATSPYLAGESSGWHSMRQHAWQGIDPARTDAIPHGEPTQAWARYALDAPVMLTIDPLQPVVERVTFADWITTPEKIGRLPSIEDLDYHLTTLFPPLRPRGYVEIRCVDALPDRWWPAVAAITALLVDDESAAAAFAAEVRIDQHFSRPAAHVGLADATVAHGVEAAVRIAGEHAPESLASGIESLHQLVKQGKSPCSELRATAEARGPLHLLLEECDA